MTDPDRWDECTAPLVLIGALLPNMSDAERRVGAAILRDPGRVARGSITALADEAQTSETTVTRFCRTIGCGGFTALRLALAAQEARDATRSGPRPRDLRIGRGDTPADVVTKIGLVNARAVEETSTHIDPAVLGAVVTALDGASRIVLYGVGPGAVAAAAFEQALHRARRPVYAWQDVHMAVTSATHLRPKDVAVAISYEGTHREALDVVSEAKRRGATTVGVTHCPSSPLAAADHVLITVARDTTTCGGQVIAQLTVLDCLFASLSQRDTAVQDEVLR